MPYQFLPDLVTADVAFKAWGSSLEEVFLSAARATMNVMVENLDAIEPQSRQQIHIAYETQENLLFNFLQEIIFYKDAEELLLLPENLFIKHHDNRYELFAKMYGEKLDRKKHHLNVDVKAVTMHLFGVSQMEGGWESMVVLDI